MCREVFSITTKSGAESLGPAFVYDNFSVLPFKFRNSLFNQLPGFFCDTVELSAFGTNIQDERNNSENMVQKLDDCLQYGEQIDYHICVLHLYQIVMRINRIVKEWAIDISCENTICIWLSP